METVGIDLDEDLKLACVKKKKNNYQIRFLKSIVKKDLLKSKFVKQIYKKRTCTGVEANDFILHELKLKAKNNSILEKTLSFQIKPLCHLVNRIDFPICQKKEEGKSYFSVFTTTDESLGKHLDVYKKISIDPDYVSTIPSALVRFAKYATNTTDGFLINVSKNRTTLVWMEEGKVKKAFSCYGASFLSKSLSVADLSNKKPINILKVKKNSEFILFSQKVGTFFLNLPKEKKAVILTGDLVHFDFIPFFKENFSDWVQNIVIPENSSFAISIGLALEGDNSDGKSVQFRQKKWIAKKFIRKISVRLASLFLFSIAGSIFFYFYKTQIIDEEDKRITSYFNSSYLLDQKRFGNEGKILSFNENYSNWNKELNSPAFPYLFSGPKVKDFLIWLDATTKDAGVKITKIHYKLLSFPKIGSLKDPYKIFIEMEYTADKIVARNFYEKISEDKEMVSKNDKIIWTPQEQMYKLSFFCKPTPLRSK